MNRGLDVECVAGAARYAIASSPLLLLLARTPQPDRGDHILAHPLRRNILAAVIARPGLTMGELRKLVPIGWGNGYHHLWKLERAGLIRKDRIGRRLVINPTSHDFDGAEAKARSYLKAKTAERICADIAGHPGTEAAAVSARTGISVRSIYYHIDQLRELGLIASRSRSRQFALHALPLYDKLRSQ